MRQSQSRILGAGADALRPGGVLVYSTCTVSPTENERLIADFLDSRPDFALDDLAAEWPEYAQTGSSVPAAGALLTLPHRDGTAGFFIARMRRS
jgi:16S rRNA (cytosine967-C5)-methyltransferase